MAALEIRKDRSPAVLRREAKGASDARVARRILAIANALDGMSREDAARSAGMDRQTLRDWVLRYNEHGLDGLSDRSGDGRPPRLTADEQAELLEIVLAGSDPETTGISAYTREDLATICDGALRQVVPPVLDEPRVETARAVAPEDAAEPPDEGPGRSSGL